MQVGIRTKEVGLLTMVGLLPLLAALAVIVFIETDRRTQSFGLSILSVAVAEARALESGIAGDIEKLELALHDQEVTGALAALDERLDAEALAQLDARWPHLGADDEALRAVLEHPIAAALRLIMEYDTRVAEALVTDRHGQLVAATGHTSDFYQADEQWWQDTYAEGAGRVHILGVDYDESAALWSVDICIPIGAAGRIVGVGKFVVDASQLIGAPTRMVGEISAPVAVFAADGSILFGSEAAPIRRPASEWAGPDRDVAGWRRAGDGQIQAFAPIRISERVGPYEVEAPGWTLALSAPASLVRAPILRLGGAILGAGMIVIAGIFIAGVAIVEREVVGRIRRIGAAARRVAHGDLSHRAAPARPLVRWLGHDELDELIRDFNDMVSRLERSYRELAQADELKNNFIRVAGHELRTPVSYIIGVGALLKNSDDPARLSEALQNAAAKGRRLEEIIRAMFKLMPEDGAIVPLRRTEVDLRRICETVLGQARAALEARDLRISVEADPDLPIVHADAPKVRDIIENLIMNAIRFTPDGGAITVRLARAGHDEALIAVENEGAQIPAEDVEHLFEPFFCATDVMTHSTGVGYQQRGVGLGLAIVRHFARLHGGEATVRQGPRGPVFEIRLPIRAPHPAGDSVDV
ncbi:MAG: ATP-binding protein [Phycisphaerales bacterium JB039]